MADARLQKDLLRGSLDLMALSVLAEGPTYGYGIQKRIGEVSGGRVRVQAGTLYPLLHRLEAEGAVHARWDRAGGRARKWYELTPAGQRRLRDQANQWQQHAATIRQLLEGALPGWPATSS